MNSNEIRLRTVLSECRKHLLRINYAYSELLPLMPLTVEKIHRLNDQQMSNIDQYIFRFSKLQDTIGHKLFKHLLLYLGEEVYNKSFIDIFNRLEQLGIVENYDLWNELRLIRNEISHEYDENKYEMAEKLNKILNSKIVLEKYLSDTVAYLERRGIT